MNVHQPALPGAEVFANSVIVERLRRSKKKVVLVFDKDNTLWSRKTLSDNERAVQQNIISVADRHADIVCSAQTVDLSSTSTTYQKSREHGLDRPPPQWLLPDGTRTDKIEEVDDLKHLLDRPVFLGFGDRPYVMQKGGYYAWDRRFDVAAGGKEWRSQMEAKFKEVFPDQWYLEHLSDIDIDGKYPLDVDVGELDYRYQFGRWKRPDLRRREEFHRLMLQSRGKGGFSNFAVADESNPAQNSWTSYFTSIESQKSRLLERFAHDLAFHSGVPLAETDYVVFGDSGTDTTMLKALQGAKSRTFGLAANSRLTRHFVEFHYEFEGVPLGWGRRWDHLPPRYEATDVPGVFMYKPHRLARPWEVIVLDYAPWSAGMDCAQSVFACMEHHLGLVD